VTIGASILLKGGVMVTAGQERRGAARLSGERPIRVLGATCRAAGALDRRVACAIVLLVHLFFFSRTLIGKAMRAVAIDRRRRVSMGMMSAACHCSPSRWGRRWGGRGHHHHAGDAHDLRPGTMLGLKGFAAR